MADLFFPHAYATRISWEDGFIRITQYEGESDSVECAVVFLTKHQFDEIYNHSKHLFSEDKNVKS